MERSGVVDLQRTGMSFECDGLTGDAGDGAGGAEFELRSVADGEGARPRDGGGHVKGAGLNVHGPGIGEVQNAGRGDAGSAVGVDRSVVDQLTGSRERAVADEIPGCAGFVVDRRMPGEGCIPDDNVSGDGAMILDVDMTGRGGRIDRGGRGDGAMIDDTHVAAVVSPPGDAVAVGDNDPARFANNRARPAFVLLP